MDFFIMSITVTLNTVLAVTVYLYNHERLENKIFLTSIFFIVLFAICNYNVDTAHSSESALFWLKALLGCASIFFYTFFLFSIVFHEKKRLPISFLTIFISGLFLCVIPYALYNNLVFSSATISNIGLVDLTFGPLYLPLHFTNLLLLFLSAAILIKKYRRSSDLQLRQQIFYILTGWTLFFFAGTLFAAILPMIFPAAINASKIIPLFSIFIVGAATYAIVRYQFLDVKIVIQRGSIYLLLTSFIVALYLLSIYTTGFIFHRTTQITIFFSAGITTLIGIFTVPILDQFLRRITSPWFFKDNYDLLDATKRISAITQSHIHMHDILREVSIATKQILSVHTVHFVSFQQMMYFNDKADVPLRNMFSRKECDILLVTREQVINDADEDIRTHVNLATWMLKCNFHIYTPIIFDDEVVGGFFIGQKKSNDAFNTKDRRLIEQLRHHLGAAMAKADLLEQEKRQSRLLEKQVKSRTREIDEMQKTQESMMVDISHALKTPLAVLRAELDMLIASSPHMDISSLQFSIDEVNKSISSLLKLARMEHASGHNPTHALIDISAIAELLCDHFSPIAAKNGITIHKNITAHCYIAGNHEEIEDLIVNLLENAIKYMPYSQKNKSITCTVDKTTNHIVLAVKDTGKGIPRKDLPHIFKRFYRAKEKHQKDVSGSGLGLAICKEIVRTHGGAIIAESPSGKGVTFKVDFPTPSPYVVQAWHENKTMSAHHQEIKSTDRNRFD